MVDETKVETLPEEVEEETSTTDVVETTEEETTQEVDSTAETETETESEAVEETSEETETPETEETSASETETEESEAEDPEIEESETEEREFDKNPTILYALVQKKLWKEVVTRAKSHPDEARAFILRKEKDGRIRWRLLPIHAAIVFKAPESVVEALLSAFPKGSEEKDDQGMLPLHLAFRNNATEGTVNMLLMAFPQSVDIPDRKGRVPLTLAKNASENSDVYVAALEKGASHYAVAALTSARERVESEQKMIYEAKLEDARKLHECALSEVAAVADKKEKELQQKVAEKEQELDKIHENSQVLVDHVTSLEAQMNTRSDTERFLATKIAKLEKSLKEAKQSLEIQESEYKSTIAAVEEKLNEAKDSESALQMQFEGEKAVLSTEQTSLLTKIDTLETSLSSTRKELDDKKSELEKKEKKLGEKIKQIEIEWANAQANCAILDTQLKKRMENEHLLASQVSTLASRLAESADNALKFTTEIKELEEGKAPLDATIHTLKSRLQKVAATMESTRKHQMTVLDDAILQEEMMAKSMESHAKMVSDSIAQEALLDSVKSEVMALLEKSFSKLQDARMESLHQCTEQGKFLSGMNGSRHGMLSSVQTVTSNIINSLNTELDLSTVEGDVAELIAAQEKESIERRYVAPVIEETRDAPEASVIEESAEESRKTTPESSDTEFITVASPKNVTSAVADFEAAVTSEAVGSGPATAE